MANKAIRQALIEKGMYQYELAELIGVSEYTLSRWMRREMPKEKQHILIRQIQEADHDRK